MQCFTTRLKYLSVLSKHKCEDEMVKPSEETVQSVAAYLHGVNGVGHETATTLLSLVESSSLTRGPAEALVSMLQSIVIMGLHPSSPDLTSEKQRHRYFHEYVQSYDLDATAAIDPSRDVFVRLQFLAELARKCGINHSDERTKAGIAAIAFVDVDRSPVCPSGRRLRLRHVAKV